MQRLLAERRRDLRLADRLQVDRQGTGLQHVGEVLCLLEAEAARDLGSGAPVDPVRVLAVVDERARDDLAVQHDREGLERALHGLARDLAGLPALREAAGDLLEVLAALVRELERHDRLSRGRIVLLARVLQVGTAHLRVVAHHEVALVRRVGWKALGPFRPQHDGALGDLQDLVALRDLPVELRQEVVARRVGAGREQLVRLEEVVGAGRGVVVVLDGLLLGRALDRRIEAHDRRLRAADHVFLPVVEEQLRGRADLLLGALEVLDARQAHRDLVVAEPLDLGLGDTEAVDALADDVDRAVDRLGRDLALRSGLALVDQLDAALQVEAELRLLGDDDDQRRDQQAERQRDHEQVAPA